MIPDSEGRAVPEGTDIRSGDHLGIPESPSLHIGCWLRYLTTRTILHRRHPVLHVVDWRPLGEPEVKEALKRAVPGRLMPLGGKSLPEVVQRATEAVYLRLPMYQMALRVFTAGLAEDSATLHQAAREPAPWWQGRVRNAVSVSSASGTIIGLLQAVGDAHRVWWIIGLWTLALSLAVGVLPSLPDVRAMRRMHRLAPPRRHRGGRTVQEWALSVSGETAVSRILARAFLFDVAYEWGWQRFFSAKKMRGPYPVLLLLQPDTAIGRLIYEEFLTLHDFRRVPALRGRVPALLVTDGISNDAPAPHGQWPDRQQRSSGPWSVEATKDSLYPPAVPDGWRSRSGTFLYRYVVAPPIQRMACFAIALLVAACVLFWPSSETPPCRTSPLSDVSTKEGERIGYQYCGTPFTNDVHETAIYRENQRVADLLAAHPHQSATLLLITSLTSGPDGRRSTLAEREGMAGAYAALMRNNNTPGQRLMRVVIANAGSGGDHIDTLVQKLRVLTEHDPSVLASVVTVDSTDSAHRALSQLTHKSSAMALISPTMEADGFAVGLPTFYPTAAPNTVQARLAYDYAKRIAPTSPLDVILPQPSTGDRYTTSLASDMASNGANSSAAPRVRIVRWTPGTAPHICDGARLPVVFYSGRFTKFPDFLHDLNAECGDNRPVLIASDSVTRFLADRNQAARIPSGTNVVVTVRGGLVSCNGASTVGHSVDSTAVVAARRDFISANRHWLGRCQTVDGHESADLVADRAGGWSAGSYDAVTMIGAMIDSAAAQYHDGKVNAVNRENITRLPSTTYTYSGALGPISLNPRQITLATSVLYCIPELNNAYRYGIPRWLAEGRQHGDKFSTRLTCPPGD